LELNSCLDCFVSQEYFKYFELKVVMIELTVAIELMVVELD